LDEIGHMIWIKYQKSDEFRRLTNFDYIITNLTFSVIRVFLIDEIEYTENSPEFMKAYDQAIMWEKLRD